MHNSRRLLGFSIAVVAISLSPATLSAAPTAAKQPEACSLITDADAQQITGVPMKRQPVKYPFNCSYDPATPVPGPKTAVYLNVSNYGGMEDTVWQTTKKAIPGKPQPLHDMGDEAFYVRSGKTDAAIYVRKGSSHFILTCGGANPDLFERMKTVVKKIVGKL
jgi:hypothetical protein